ncbi:porin family protein [Conchiformibius kuhniae]|uniref:Surface lipoprotein assembly modifier n=1 Tax=Conchiformibius kuhniae TaxID=211502 RepID=A0ABD8B6Y5_9NEIS|nr:porin family protein [Conchiformibius kuhniae]
MIKNIVRTSMAAWLLAWASVLPAADNTTLPGKPLGKTAQAPSMLSESEQQQLERALVVSVNPYDIARANQNAVRFLANEYRTRVSADKRDDSLLDWADIILNIGSDWQRTVQQYRKLLDKFPQQSLLRFQLAQALFHNGEPDAAQREFEKFRATPNLTLNHEKEADRWIMQIQQRQKWQFDLQFQLLNNSNVNQAPRHTVYYRLPGGATFSNAETAQRGYGYRLGLNAQKRWHLPLRYHALRLNTGLDFDHYLNLKKYSRIDTNVGLGWLYETPRHQAEVQPFWRKAWNARGEGRRKEGRMLPYSDEYGVRFRVWHWLNTRFQYDLMYQPSYVKYDNPIVARTSDASRHFVHASLSYQPNSKQNWQLGAHWSLLNAKDKTNANKTVGVNLGWRQEWPKSFYTDLTVGASRVRNQAPYWFGLRRTNHIYSVNAQVFNPTWQFKGFMPRLVVNYQKNKSNLTTQSYDTRDAYIFIQKTF